MILESFGQLPGRLHHHENRDALGTAGIESAMAVFQGFIDVCSHDAPPLQLGDVPMRDHVIIFCFK